MEKNEIFRTHPSIRNSLKLVLLAALFAVVGPILVNIFWTDAPSWVWLGLIILGVATFAYAWIRKYFDTYVVRSDAVMARRGLLSKFTTEIRIADIRAINVRQNLVQRVLGIGDTGFSSAAGDTEEVIFRGVRNPDGIKANIQTRMDHLRDEGAQLAAGGKGE